MPNLIGVHEATVPKPERSSPAPDCLSGTQAPSENRRHGQHASQRPAPGPAAAAEPRNISPAPAGHPPARCGTLKHTPRPATAMRAAHSHSRHGRGVEPQPARSRSPHPPTKLSPAQGPHRPTAPGPRGMALTSFAATSRRQDLPTVLQHATGRAFGRRSARVHRAAIPEIKRVCWRGRSGQALASGSPRRSWVVMGSSTGIGDASLRHMLPGLIDLGCRGQILGADAKAPEPTGRRLMPASRTRTRGKPMKAVVWHDVGDVRLDTVPEPKLEHPTDAIVRITTAAICGTDLHFIRGTVPGMRPGEIIGHEGVGVVEEVGRDIRNFKSGDRVLLSAVLGCGSCAYCRRGYFAQCDNVNPTGSRAGTGVYGAPLEHGGVDGRQGGD